jgi:transposase InsO family protein
VLQEWKNGMPLEEVCRKYGVNAAQMYRWQRSLDQGLKESGEMVPKNQVLGLQKRVEELERALGRKALEVDLFKKSLRAQGPPMTRGDLRWLARVAGCSLAFACRVLGKPRSWLYYRRQSGRRWPVRRLDVEAAISELVGASPASYGYRRIHALLKRQGLVCGPKTVWRIMRRRGWLATGRLQRARSGQRHEGHVRVAEPNRRWASDITGIRAWDGQKGRLAIMIDCADRMVLAWRFAKRITSRISPRCYGRPSSSGSARPAHAPRGSSSSATMGRSTRRIGFAPSCERWG